MCDLGQYHCLYDISAQIIQTLASTRQIAIWTPWINPAGPPYVMLQNLVITSSPVAPPTPLLMLYAILYAIHDYMEMKENISFHVHISAVRLSFTHFHNGV